MAVKSKLLTFVGEGAGERMHNSYRMDLPSTLSFQVRESHARPQTAVKQRSLPPPNRLEALPPCWALQLPEEECFLATAEKEEVLTMGPPEDRLMRPSVYTMIRRYSFLRLAANGYSTVLLLVEGHL